MKTKSTNPTTIGEKTNTRNLFQKTFILLAVLAFTIFGFKANAQRWTFTVTNNAPSGCNWLVVLADGSGGYLNSFTSNGGSGTVTFGCFGPFAVDNIAVSYTGGGCMGFTFGSGGSFPYTSYLTTCCGATSIDCQGGTTTRNCSATPPVGDYNITININ
jgi:hypothetical protein